MRVVVRQGFYCTVKSRTFDSSVSLYNIELRTLNKILETVNTFRRRHDRKILDVHRCMSITNIELHQNKKTEEWSTTIQNRRLQRRNDTPFRHSNQCRLALYEYLRKVKRPNERSQCTWKKLIKHDLNRINIILDYNIPNQTTECHMIKNTIGAT